MQGFFTTGFTVFLQTFTSYSHSLFMCTWIDLGLNKCKSDEPIWREREYPEVCRFYNLSIDPHQHEQENNQLYILLFTQKCSNDPPRCEPNYLQPFITLYLIPDTSLLRDYRHVYIKMHIYMQIYLHD